MAAPQLVRVTSHGVTLLGDPGCPGGVTLAFTERTGGVSMGEFSSLNLGDACGDDPTRVAENRRRALAALGREGLEARLVNPVQAHGDHVVVVRSDGGEELAHAKREAREGADAVVCTAADVPVLLCSADCVLVVLVSEGGFAVVHSGWRGTIERICAKAARILCDETGGDLADVSAYVGPHVGGDDYEVSPELLERFVAEFGPQVARGARNLDLGVAVTETLEDAGVWREHIVCCDDSTASNTQRFFSYRAEGGVCGRQGALVVMGEPQPAVGFGS